MTLSTLRSRLIECFEPDFRIVGNITQCEIVEAIDAEAARLAAMTSARDELYALSHVPERNQEDEWHAAVERSFAVGKEPADGACVVCGFSPCQPDSPDHKELV